MRPYQPSVTEQFFGPAYVTWVSATLLDRAPRISILLTAAPTATVTR